MDVNETSGYKRIIITRLNMCVNTYSREGVKGRLMTLHYIGQWRALQGYGHARIPPHRTMDLTGVKLKNIAWQSEWLSR
jgi:hypothetical protein